MRGNKCLSTFVVLLAVSALPAQQRLISAVRGDLQVNGPAQLMSDYQIEVAQHDGHLADHFSVAADGSFWLRNVAAGISQVRVLGSHNEILHEEYLNVEDGITISLRLESQKKAEPASGKVSVHALAHTPPAGAVKEYRKAKTGDPVEAIAHFRRAVEADPAFFQAWNDLGVHLMSGKKYSEAAEAFAKAADLSPDSALILSNLSVALLQLHKFPESEKYAARAVALDSNSKNAQTALNFIHALKQR